MASFVEQLLRERYNLLTDPNLVDGQGLHDRQREILTAELLTDLSLDPHQSEILERMGKEAVWGLVDHAVANGVDAQQFVGDFLNFINSCPAHLDKITQQARSLVNSSDENSREARALGNYLLGHLSEVDKICSEREKRVPVF